MKHYRIFLALTALVVASLACNAMSGKKDNSATPQESSSGGQTVQPAATTEPSTNSNTDIKTDFPITADAYNAIDVGDGSLLYYTKMSQADVMKFYRDTYTAKGYKERELLTVTSDTTFSMVFDGDPSGKAVVIQSVNLGDGSSTVAIRLEDV
jgi:flagellar basal body rod protein FlgG